jgi:hypothetical protein
MPVILVVALVCASSVAAQDCTRETAQDVITAPAHSAQECLIMGPTMVAGAGRSADGSTYVKTLCERRH